MPPGAVAEIMSSGPACKICSGPADRFDVVDFEKTCSIANTYPRGLSGTPVYYFRCRNCGFIFTDFFDTFTEHDWKRQVYNPDYKLVDPEYADARPRSNARYVKLLLSGWKHRVIGLDFGGGNGLTAMLLRQQGWQFDSYDPFGLTTATSSRMKTYNVTIAFEVFEHLLDPVSELAHILDMMTSDKPLIVIGTATTDGRVDDARRLSWWYAAPRNGHISLYSRRSLCELARKYQLECISASGGTHFMVRGLTRASLLTRFALTAPIMRLRRQLKLTDIPPTSPPARE